MAELARVAHQKRELATCMAARLQRKAFVVQRFEDLGEEESVGLGLARAEFEVIDKGWGCKTKERADRKRKRLEEISGEEEELRKAEKEMVARDMRGSARARGQGR
jgi:hypothetical protein